MGTKNYNNYSDMITFSRASTGTYLDSDGLLKSAAINTPRVEYDYQGNRLGLLVEEARTNYNNDSQITSSGWTPVRSSLDTSESALFLDGTIAPRLKEDTTAFNSHHIQDIHTLASSSAVAVFSVFVKKPDLNSRDYVALKLIDDPAGSFKSYTVVFDASDGTFQDDGITSSPSATFYGSTQYPNGWVRIWLGFTKAGTATRTDAQIALSGVSTVDATGTLPAYTGDGVSGLYVCGAQMEQGSFPTSYIPTSGATATRSADVASIGVGAFGHHPKVHTILLTAINGGVDNGIGTGNDANSVIRFGTGFVANYSSIGIGSSSFRVDRVDFASRSDGGPVEAVEYGVDDSFTNGQVAKVAAIFDTRTNVITGCVDNETIFASTGTNPIGGIELPFTEMQFRVGQGKMHISSIAYYPRRLTDAQIKALTSPPETPTLSLTFDDSSTSYLETSIHG